MRILLMADTPRDPNSGAAGTEVHTADALREQGHEVDEIWAPALGRRIVHGNLHYLFELPRNYRREMLRAFARGRYDVVHVNQPHGWLAARTLARLRSDAVFVHRSHGVELHVESVLKDWRIADTRGFPRRMAASVLSAMLSRHCHLVARYADGHIVSATADAAFLQHQLGVPPDRIAVIPQAPPDEFNAAQAVPMSSDRLRRILYVGQFAAFKAPQIVAAAMNALAARAPDLHFTWVCSQKDHPAIRELASIPSLELLDWMPAEQLLKVYYDHGIFLFPSLFEGFGKAFLEAMSRGLCVVASDVGGAHDVIESGSNGLLVPPGDAAAVADAALALLADPVAAATMSAEAARSSRTYTWQRVGWETAAFYERLRAMRR